MLKLRNLNLQVKDCQQIGKVISDFKFITELDLSHTNLSLACAKEIADGLMRAK